MSSIHPIPSVDTGYPVGSAIPAVNINANPNPNPNRNPRNPNPNRNPYDDRQLNPRPKPRFCDYLIVGFCGLFLVGVVIFILYSIVIQLGILVSDVIDPHEDPAVTLNSLSVSSFNLTADSLSADFDLALTIYNEDSRMSIHYDRLLVTVYLGQAPDYSKCKSCDAPIEGYYPSLDRLASTSLPPVFHSKKTSTNHNARMLASSVFIGEDTANSIRSGYREGDGNIVFKIFVGAVAKFDCSVWRHCPPADHVMVPFFCPAANVAFKNAKGTMNNGPIRCESTIK